MTERKSFLDSVFEALHIQNTRYFTEDLIEGIQELNQQNIYPTIIINMKSGEINDYETGLYAVDSIFRDIASNCHCFIVLEEFYGIFELRRTSSLKNHIFVDELSIEEAKEFFIKSNYSITDKEMKYIFDNIGTKIDFLLEILTEVPNKYSIKEFVSKKLHEAKQDLVAFPLQTVLKALKEHPEGIDPLDFSNHTKEDIDLIRYRTKMMKKYPNSIIYRDDKRKYHLLSTAHKTALKSYNPIP